ncbi:unnamed protein product, partial [Owenia fusiformis]
ADERTDHLYTSPRREDHTRPMIIQHTPRQPHPSELNPGLAVYLGHPGPLPPGHRLSPHQYTFSPGQRSSHSPGSRASPGQRSNSPLENNRSRGPSPSRYEPKARHVPYEHHRSSPGQQFQRSYGAPPSIMVSAALDRDRDGTQTDYARYAADSAGSELQKLRSLISDQSNSLLLPLDASRQQGSPSMRRSPGRTPPAPGRTPPPPGTGRTPPPPGRTPPPPAHSMKPNSRDPSPGPPPAHSHGSASWINAASNQGIYLPGTNPSIGALPPGSLPQPYQPNATLNQNFVSSAEATKHPILLHSMLTRFPSSLAPSYLPAASSMLNAKSQPPVQPPSVPSMPRLMAALQKAHSDVPLLAYKDIENRQPLQEKVMPRLTQHKFKVEDEGMEVGNKQTYGAVKQEKLERPPSPEDVNPFNHRVKTLNNFPAGHTGYRATYRSHSVAIHKAKAGSIVSAARSLDLLRQNLQKDINKEIDVVIQRYLDSYFKPGIENIKINNGDTAVCDEHIQGVCRTMLEEAKKMYFTESSRSVTPIDFPDNLSDAGSTIVTESRASRMAKSLFNIKKRRGSDTDSEASQPLKRKKKGRAFTSGRGTPSKLTKVHEPVKKEGPKWDPERLNTETEFIMGAKANKALGLGATRGRLYIKHPETFKYTGDQDDKQWLYENQRMPATGGKSYMLIMEDIKDLFGTDEYKNSTALIPQELKGFTVPEWMIEKIKKQMRDQRTDLVSFKNKQRSRSSTPVSALEKDGVATDTDSDKNLPFSNTYNSTDKSLAAIKLDPMNSPTTTEGDLDYDEQQVSPFNMASGIYGDASPAPGRSPSHSDIYDHDEPPLSAPFQIS